MNKKQQLKKITVLISFIALCLAGAIYTNRFFNTEIVQQQEAKLAQEIELLSAVIKQYSPQLQDVSNSIELQKFISENERLTLLDAQGVIIFDSSQDKQAVGQRSQRPEVEQVLKEQKKQGTSLRESRTLNETFLYVAKPLYLEEKLIGVIRLSEKYQGFSASIRRFQRIIIVAFIVLVIGIVMLLFYFIRQTTEPLRFILPTLQEAIAHPEKQQKLDATSPEWNQLYHSVNQLMRETNQLYYQQLFSEEKLHFLLESLTIGVVIMDSHLQIVSANPMMQQFFKQKADHLPISYQDWFQQADIRELIEEISQTGQEIQEEIHLYDEQAKDLSVVFKVLQPDSQQPREYVGIFYDITAIRHLEVIHQDFISNISHELKTPTTSIIGFTETLLDGALAEADVAEHFVGIIQLEANRLAALIQNILLLLRTETSLAERDIVSVSPLSILEEEISRYAPKIDKKSLKITTSFNQLGKTEVPSDYFQPIVKNLLENAVDYTEEGGQLHLSLRVLNNELLFSVADTGVGISVADQERVFERFYRVSKSRQRNLGGSGLGLSIVSHYTQLLKGTVSIDSQLAIGTKVIVKLPLT